MPPRRRGRSGSRTGGGHSSSGGPSDSKPPAALHQIMRQRQKSSLKSISGSMSKASKCASESVPRSVSPSSSSSLPTEISSDSGYDSSNNEDFDSDSAESGGNIAVVGSKTKASEDASESVPRSVSPSSSSSIPTEVSSGSGYGSSDNEDYYSGYVDSDDSDSPRALTELDEDGKRLAALIDSLPCRGLMLLLFETPSGFALFTFSGVYCHQPSSVDYLWSQFADPVRASLLVFRKGFLSFEDKSSAINADTGVDKQLVDLINKWHRPGMKLCVGKSEYNAILESATGIECMCCQIVMEIMWCMQQHLGVLVPKEKSKLTKEDRLPPSQGLMKFLTSCGFDVKPEMVNKEIFVTACALYNCDLEDNMNLELLRDAVPYIRDISGIACEDWDLLMLAKAVKVICCPKEELSDFHEVLAEDVVSKLKGDARKYKYVAIKVCWLGAYDTVVSNHHLRIVKKKLLVSLVEEAKKVYEAEQSEVCEKVKLHGEAEQIAQVHVTSVSNLSTSLLGDPTTLVGKGVRRSPRLNQKLYDNSDGYKHACVEGTRAQDPVTSVSNLSTSLVGDSTTLAGEVVRRSPRLKRKMYENSGDYKFEGTAHKRPKYCCTCGTSTAMDDKKSGQPTI